MWAVGGAKALENEDVTEPRQRCLEGLDLFRTRLDLFSSRIYP